MSINLTDELLAKTKKGKIASAKQVFLEGDTENLQQIGDKTHQLEDAIKDITVSGGASTATAVSYNNETSGMTAVTAQGAIDELAAKNQEQEAAIGTKAEKSEVATELDKKFNKENIAQEFGESKDKVVSQFALPFREIESPEFLHCIVDAEDRFLFGIQLDGSIEWGKGIPAPIRTKLQEIITQCQQDKNTINGILHKTTIKDEAGEIQDTPFRVIENEEFIMAIADSEDRVLFGIYRATGEPYYPLNDMYHVEQNDEFLAVWLDSNNHVLMGIRKDGQIIGEIHAVNALKQVVSQIKEDIMPLLSVFSLHDNQEFLAVETDSNNKVLAATYADGSHYSHNLKSETLDAKVDKEEGKSLIDAEVATAQTSLEDPEGRMEITVDADNRLLGYRDSKGIRHENKMSIKHLALSDEAAKEVNETFKSAGIKMETPSDFSKETHLELPIPRIAAQVRIYAPKLPTTKTDDIEAEIEYNDKDGNYFRKPIILNAQGSSSMRYYVKNMAIDLNDGSEIKFGDFPTQDSFHIKKYYIDAFRGQCIVGYHLIEQMYQTRTFGERRPWDYLNTKESVYDSTGKVAKDFDNCAKSHPDGFPIIITWVNTTNNEETKMGVYAWNLKKSKEVYNANKKTAENIILDGQMNGQTLFGGSVDWSMFEIRNPKSLIDIDGNKYDGDNPKELSDTDSSSKKVKDYITRLSGAMADLKENPNKETFEKYFNVPFFIDYFLQSQVTYNIDGFNKNWIWCTWDGLKWNPNIYDEDSIFGLNPATGSYIHKNSDNSSVLGATNNTLPTYYLASLYKDEIEARYKELRDNDVFSVQNIVGLLESWLERIGYDNLKEDLSLFPETHSYRNSGLNDGWELENYAGQANEYDNSATYNVGDKCSYYRFVFRATKTLTGVPPTNIVYEHGPIYIMGFHNSIKRVRVWLENRITFLDNNYKYNQ